MISSIRIFTVLLSFGRDIAMKIFNIYIPEYEQSVLRFLLDTLTFVCITEDTFCVAIIND